MKTTKLGKLFSEMKKRKVRGLLIKIAVVLFILSLSLVFFKQVFSLMLTLLLILIASLSKIYKRFTRFSIGFELVTFATIILFFAHGLSFGIILSALMIIMATLISGRFSQVFVFQFIIYIIIGVLTLFLRELGIVTAGKILVLVYNIFLHMLTFFILRMPLHSSVFNFVVNIATNFLLLDFFGEWIVEHL